MFKVFFSSYIIFNAIILCCVYLMGCSFVGVSKLSTTDSEGYQQDLMLNLILENEEKKDKTKKKENG